MPLAIAFPQIDPVLVQIGPFAVHWYALAYIVGIVAGWYLCRKIVARTGWGLSPDDFDDFVTWATLGIIIGGRVGYVVFYQTHWLWTDPLSVFAVWQGGMSFHGGAIGVAVATILYCRRKNLPLLDLGDAIASVAPIGLFLGRIANFINAELYGRASDVSWAVIFPTGGPEPRHPSQLYEAALEGLLLFVILQLLVWRKRQPYQQGQIVGWFLIGYGAARFFVEFFREPDAHLGFLFSFITMGQLLSLPFVILGILFLLGIFRSGERKLQ